MSTSDCSNLVNSDSSFIETNNSTAGKIPDELNMIKNILVSVYDKSGVISNMKKVVLPFKQKSNLYETSKEDSKMLIIDNIMQQMGNVQKEDTSTISIENKCKKWYPSKLLLEKYKVTHEDYPYLQCPMCHLKYKRKTGLKYHHIRVHSNVEPKFTYDHCRKRFKLKIDLVGHIEKTHLNARHVCKIYGKIVKNITHHEWQYDKAAKRNAFKYSCDVYRKKFSTRNHLDNHPLMHKDGFKCTLCDEAFSSPYSLSSHKITKHKRNSMCTICERSFPSTTNFYQHVITHEGDLINAIFVGKISRRDLVF